MRDGERRRKRNFKKSGGRGRREELKERRRGRRERRLSLSFFPLFTFSFHGAHTSVPEFLEAPLDPLDLQQEMKHFVVRLHQRGCEDGVQGPRNLKRESVNTTVHATLSMYTTSHRPAVKELIATIEATVDAVLFQGSCTGATQEPGNEAVDGAARLH